MYFSICLAFALSCWSTSNAELEASVRLVGGTDKLSGRLEVKVGRLWGTVCDDNFDEKAAHVACRQMGHRTGVLWPIGERSVSGQGRGLIWMDELTCDGNETDLSDCMTKQLNHHNCIHYEDVFLKCYPHIRMTGGNDFYTGLVEIQYMDIWGGICSDKFDNAAAVVACSELGYKTGEVRKAIDAPSHTSSHMWLDHMLCNGNEESLSLCERGKWGDYTCYSTDPVVVRCYPGISDNYTLRLSGGDDNLSGLLEIQYLGIWGTVCNHLFDNNVANVLCREMGFTSGQFLRDLIHKPYHKAENDKIWLDNILCHGEEMSLRECSVNKWGVHHCNHSQDVIMECFNGTQSGSYDLRMVGGIHQQTGRLEIQYAGIWLVFVKDSMNEAAADVVCRDMGFVSGGIRHDLSNVTLSDDDQIWQKQIKCHGNESRLTDCVVSEWGAITPVQQKYELHIWCTNNPELTIKLVDKGSTFYGNLVIKYGGEWYYILYDTISSTYENEKIMANIVCGQLGFSTSVYPFQPAWSNTITKIWPYNMYCYGYERVLSDCIFMADLNIQSNINIGQEINNLLVSCQKYDLHLAGGPSSAFGKLMLTTFDSMSLIFNYTICNASITENIASVACREMGFMYGRIWDVFQLPRDTITSSLGDIQCSGHENALQDCYNMKGFFEGGCRQEDGNVYGVHIKCYNKGEYDLRMVDGQDATSGQLEVFYNGEWGQMCWKEKQNHVAAALACNYMAFSTGIQLASRRRYPGGRVWLDNLVCHGNENSFDECQHYFWGVLKSEYCHILVVRCWNDLRLQEISLSQWPHVSSGFLQIQYDGIWGAVCGQNIDDQEAIVACRELGFDMGKIDNTTENLPDLDGQIWLGYVDCVGSEYSISQCQHGFWGMHDCNRNDDLFVQCWNDYADEFKVRMTNGSDRFSGLLEVFYHSAWGSVCADLWFNDHAASVACREMGFTSGIKVNSSLSLRTGSSTIWLADVRCTGREKSLLECYRGGWGVHECTYDQDVYVQCFVGDYELRTGLGGRLEIQYQGRWAGISTSPRNEHLELNQRSKVACRQMGYDSGADAIDTITDFYERMDFYWDLLWEFENEAYEQNKTYCTIKRWVHYLFCNGKEKTLQECNMEIGPETETDCYYLTNGPEVFVRCWYAELQIIPLDKSSNNSTGQLEVKLDGVWGTVCDDLFSDSHNAASVACVEIGFASGEFVSSKGEDNSTTPTLEARVPIWLDDVVCDGTEKRLGDCWHAEWGQHNCDHTEDVIIKCNA